MTDLSTSPGLAVLHVATNHRWNDNRVNYRECQTLAEHGYAVTLLARGTNVDPPAEGPVDVRAVPGLRLRGRFFIAPLRAIRLALKLKATIVHLHDADLAVSVPVLRVLRKTVIWDAHEDFPDQVTNSSGGTSLRRLFLRIWAHGAVRLGGMASAVVVATEKIAERYPQRKVRIVHNYPPVDPDEVLPTSAGRANAVVYVGGMSEVRGTHVMVEAVMHADWPVGWKLVVAGSGDQRLLASLSDPAVADRISFLGQVPPQAARLLLREARVGLVPFQDTPAHRFSLPTKMFEYFEAGLPVVASDFPLWRSIIGVNDCGRLVDQTSPAAVAAAVAEYARDEGLCSRQGGNARRMAVDEYNWAREGRTLVDLYDKLTGPRGGIGSSHHHP
jgi:glycosyltransferase involved in cell wall biosynthesis